MSFWEGLLDIHRRLDDIDYYELLGVDRRAGVSEITERYYKLTARMHPDKFSRERDRIRQQALTQVVARISEAFRVLKTESTRRQYDTQLESGSARFSAESEQARSGPDPASAVARGLYDKGMALLKAGDKARAKMQLQMAKQFEPGSKAIERALTEASGTAPVSSKAEDSRDSTLPAAAPPTQPKLPERTEPGMLARRHPRVETQLSVNLRLPTARHVEVFKSRDISRGGMFLRMKKPLPMDSTVELKIALPDGSALELGAVVVRTNPEGVGVRFLELSKTTQETLQAQVTNLQRQADKERKAIPHAALARRLQQMTTLADHVLLGIKEDATAEQAKAAHEQRLVQLTDIESRSRDPRDPAVLGEMRKHMSAALHRFTERASHPFQDADTSVVVKLRRASTTMSPDRPDKFNVPTQSLLSSDWYQDPETAVAESDEATRQAKAGMALLAGKCFTQAREMLAAAIEQLAYDACLQAAWFYAAGCEERESGNVAFAREHFENALAHFPQCEEAVIALRGLPDDA